MRTQIYFLVCPVSKKVSYIGLSADAERRYLQHLADKSDCSKARWIQALQEIGQKPQLVIVNEVDEELAKEEEARWIAFGLSVGWPLRNESLPNPDYIKWPYTLPKYDLPPYVRETVFKYKLPASVAVRPEISLLHRIKLRLFGGDLYPHIMRVWFYTTDKTKFCMYYSKSKDDQAVYVDPLLIVLFDESCDMRRIKIHEMVWPFVIEPRKTVDSMGKEYEFDDET